MKKNYVIKAFITLIGAIIVYYFSQHFWWPPDSGAYLFTASKILNGSILNKEIQDIHMGYVNFMNTLPLYIFGDQIFSIRIPLIVLTVIQSLLIFRIFEQKGFIYMGILASLLIISLSFIQFINPTANWYALFLAILVISIIELKENNSNYIKLIGFLLMVTFCFRQLSGVFLTIAAISLLILKKHREQSKKGFLAQVILILFLFIIVVYLYKLANFSAILFYGIWPTLILGYLSKDIKVSNQNIITMVVNLILGAIIGILPLLIYHLINGSFLIWIDDTVIRAFSITQMDFVNSEQYIFHLMKAINLLINYNSFFDIINGLFWIILLLSPIILGSLVLKNIIAKNYQKIFSVVFITVFFGLVSIHYQILIYLFYSVGLTIISLVYISLESSTLKKSTAVLGTFLCTIALLFHAAKPIDESNEFSIYQGSLKNNYHACNLQKCNIKITSPTKAKYDWLVNLILSETKEQDSILPIPFNPELNYLTNRDSPFRFFMTAIGIQSDIELNSSLKLLSTNKPKMVIHNTTDKYNNFYSEKIMEYVISHYTLQASKYGFNIYIL